MTYNRRVDIAATFDATAFMLREALKDLTPFMSRAQLVAIRQGARGEEGEYFIAKAVELAAIVHAMPATYETDGQTDPVAHLHYFTAGCDWWITEKDKGDPDDETPGEQRQAYGLACLHEAERGYISIAELIRFTGMNAELDFHFAPRPLSQVHTR